jgi:hypothetical protein
MIKQRKYDLILSKEEVKRLESIYENEFYLFRSFSCNNI